MDQPTRMNGPAMFGMIFAVLPIISIIFLMACGYVLTFAAPNSSWGTLVEALMYPLSCFMLASYPLAFILGIVGLRQITKSEGREKGKGLAWTAIALSSGYFLLLIGGSIYILAFGPGLPTLPPIETHVSQMPISEGGRFDFPLFSIGLPEGSGWTYQPLESGISFETEETLDDQKTVYSQRTTVAMAWYEALDQDTNYSKQEFLEFACTYLGSPQEGNRYTEQQSACNWWRKSTFDCVRFEGQYMDHGSQDHPYSPPLILDGQSLACRHPDFYNAVIFLHYSQRGPEGSIQDNVSEQADTFFMNMGMNYPPGTPPVEFEYETGQEIQTAQPGTNLALLKQVRVSRELSDFPAPKAVDGSHSNWWGAGARPPQWIEIDLGANYVISEVGLLISQSPSGRTIHRVLARGTATADEFVLIHTFDGVTSDSQTLTFELPDPLQGVRYIRIETAYSPSWVGWREIEVIAGE